MLFHKSIVWPDSISFVTSPRLEKGLDATTLDRLESPEEISSWSFASIPLSIISKNLSIASLLSEKTFANTV